MDLRHIIHHPSRLHDVKFCKRVNGEGEVLLVAAEDKKVSIYDLPLDPDKAPSIVAEMVGHSNRSVISTVRFCCTQLMLQLCRVKAAQVLQIALPSSCDRSSTTIVSTISSDGMIHIYDLAELPASEDEKHQMHPAAVYDTKGSRLTCLALADGEASSNGPSANGKRKRSADDGVEDSEDDYEDWDASHENGAPIGVRQEEVEGEYEGDGDSGSDSDEG